MNAREVGDQWLRLVVGVVVVAITGCGTSTGAPRHDLTAPSGNGTAAGTVEAHAFGVVGASYLVGRSDDPANTTVIYLFDAKVSCGEIDAPGWDSRIADGTGALELKVLGTKAGSYPVSTTPNGASGESSVNFTVSSKSGTPREEASSAGFVQLDSLAPGTSADGSFDLTFADGTLRGTFSAAWCANGHEP